jgi:hypothetical protein
MTMGRFTVAASALTLAPTHLITPPWVRSATAGLANQTRMLSGPDKVAQQRLPRPLCPQAPIAPYADAAALGASWLHRLTERQRRHRPSPSGTGGTYLWHYWLAGDDAVLLLTDVDVWCFRPATVTVLWRIPLRALARCEGRETALDLVVDAVPCDPLPPLNPQPNPTWLVCSPVGGPSRLTRAWGAGGCRAC